MKKHLLNVLCLLVSALVSASCANNPGMMVTVVDPNGTRTTTVATLGQSLAEDTSSESATVTLPGGSTMTYSKTGKVQTTVPGKYMSLKGIEAVGNATVKGVRALDLNLGN